MERALFHAARGAGRTSPNPLVGAVVVSAEGVVVGQGFHQRAGEAHAEVHALAEAGSRARGATLYCTLEPCCHQGRTGPCVSRIVDAGVARVVAAVEDPNPAVRGRGFRYLEAHGVAMPLASAHRASAERAVLHCDSTWAAVRDREGRGERRRLCRGSAGAVAAISSPRR